jgi:hypothetical protein
VQASPGWALTATTYPTNFTVAPPAEPRVSGTIALEMMNIGSSAAGCTGAVNAQELSEGVKDLQCGESPSENPITVTDRLPPGVRAVEAGELQKVQESGGLEPVIHHALWSCTGNGPGSGTKVEGATEVTCTNKATKDSPGEQALEIISGGGGVPTFAVAGIESPAPIIGIAVDVQSGAAPHETDTASIAGGGAPAPAETSVPVTISNETPPYELTKWTGWFSNADGTIDEQAGSHPYEAYFDFGLATALNSSREATEVTGSELRTAEVELPEGVIGDPTAVPGCTRELFVAERCPSESMIGTTTAYFANEPALQVQVFNLAPPPGVPAEFGFSLQGLNTFLDASVRTGGDYGVTEHVSTVAHKEITQAITTLWGQSGDASHNRWRSGRIGGCSRAELESAGQGCSTGLFAADRPLLTLPTRCGVNLPFVLRTTAYTGAVSERTFYMHDQSEQPLEISSCESLAFAPTLAIQPELSMADSPTGLNVDVTPALAGLQQPHGRGSSDIRDATVALPRGFVVNPGQAANLQACTAEEAALGPENTAAPSCPAASKVGTATAKSPLIEGALEKELQGGVYLLASNPPDLKLLAALSADGVNVKLMLNATLDPTTGQIVTTVENAPQLPVSDFTLAFSGGEHASVDTPTGCGTYQADSTFTPWSSPGSLDFSDPAFIGISTGAEGRACPGSQLPFVPSLSVGTASTQAGGFTGLLTMLSRGDGQQRIDGLRFTAPPGIAGMISSVPLCPEPQASGGTCPTSSLIGHASVLSGPGARPLVIPQPGEPAPQIFLTGPYRGSPFGLSIVSRLLAGPFDLGTIVTRAGIDVDPRTAQVTVTTDPLPRIIRGVPTDIRAISAVIDRPGFIFNPTACKTGVSIGQAQGGPPPYSAETPTVAPVSSTTNVTGCRALAFTPKLTVTAPARTSRVLGAGLAFKLVYPHERQGAQSNIALTKVDLPKQLPSRITTLNHACLAATFEANPAHCPPRSVVGHAIVHTPVLPTPLAGPAYFVSHGNEAFPSLTIVLQGDGVTIDLVGATLIKKGITSTTFKTVPDVPFSTFELTLPRGEYSAVGAFLPSSASNSLCGQRLKLPTQFVAENGLELHKDVPVSVTGCSARKHKPSRNRNKAHGEHVAKPASHG